MKKFLYFLVISAIAGITGSCCDPIIEEPPLPPVVKTKASVKTISAEEITTSSAVLSGKITNTGNCPIIARGFCWSDKEAPWFDSTRYHVSFVEGSDSCFSDTLPLLPGTKYRIKAFVKNEIDVSYGNMIIITTLGSEPEFSIAPTVECTDSSATFHFAVDNNLLETSVVFRYGLTEEYGQTVIEEVINSPQEYSFTLSLNYGTRYYYQIEIKNSLRKKTISRNFQTLTPDCVDIDGNVYKSVKIGNQIWITRNFDATRYNDGTEIPYVASDEDWLRAGEEKMGARCFYNNDPELRTIYGTLYNWYTIDTGKLAPEGWHVPTNAEWDTLGLALCYLDKENQVSGYVFREAGTAHWKEPNLGATNASGFTALPGGARYNTISGGILEYTDLISDGYWWSADENREGVTRIVYTSYDIPYLMNDYALKNFAGISIRLVMD